MSGFDLLIGVVLVIYQLQQAGEIARVKLEAHNFEEFNRSGDMIMGERLAASWAKAMANSRELTDKDLVVIDAFLSNNRRTFYAVKLQHEKTLETLRSGPMFPIAP